jgi:hypothetical protein
VESDSFPEKGGRGCKATRLGVNDKELDGSHGHEVHTMLPRDEHLRRGEGGWFGVILSCLDAPCATRILSPEPKPGSDGWRDVLDPPEAPGGGRVSTRGTRGGRHRGIAEHLARAEAHGFAALDDERSDTVVDEGD